MLDKKLIGLRIKELRIEKNQNQEAFSSNLGITRSALSQIESGKISPSLDLLNILVNAYSTTFEWIVSGTNNLSNNIHLDKKTIHNATFFEGEKMHGKMHGFMHGNNENRNPNATFLGDKSVQAKETQTQKPSITYFSAEQEHSQHAAEPAIAYQQPQSIVNKGIPLLPIEGLAGWGLGDFSVLEHEATYYTIPEFKGVDFLIRVKGSSMYPKYSSGDIVACNYIKESNFIQWGKVYVLDTTQGAIVKRLFPTPNPKEFECKSDNPAYPPFILHKNEIRAIALVTGVIRLE